MTACVRSAPGEGSLEGSLPDHIEAEFNEELWHGEHAPRLQAASLVIGLHPDQACRTIMSCSALATGVCENEACMRVPVLHTSCTCITARYHVGWIMHNHCMVCAGN